MLWLFWPGQLRAEGIREISVRLPESYVGREVALEGCKKSPGFARPGYVRFTCSDPLEQIVVTVDGQAVRTGNVIKDLAGAQSLSRLTISYVEVIVSDDTRELAIQVPAPLADRVKSHVGPLTRKDVTDGDAILQAEFQGVPGNGFPARAFSIGDSCWSRVASAPAGEPFRISFDCRFVKVTSAIGEFAKGQSGLCVPQEQGRALLCAATAQQNTLEIAMTSGWAPVELPVTSVAVGETGSVAVGPSDVAPLLSTGLPVSAPPLSDACPTRAWQLTFSGYCSSDDKNNCSTANRSAANLSFGEATRRLPTLTEGNWREKKLPTHMQLRLTPPGSGEHEEVVVPINDASTQLTQRIAALDVTPYALEIAFEGGMDEKRYTELVFYDDPQCVHVSESVPATDYTKGHVKTINTRACLFGQVREKKQNNDGNPLSRCAALAFNGKTATALLPSLTYDDKRMVILIAKTHQLSEPISVPLKEAMTGWLSAVREGISSGGAKYPLSVASIDETGVVNTVIRAEDLPALSGDDFRTKMTQLASFRGNAQNPLRDLTDLDFAFPNSLQSILYIVDDSLSTKSEPIRGSEIGAPLLWRANNIPFIVLTTGSCHLWNDVVRSQECWQFQAGSDAGTLRNYFEKFLKDSSQ